MNGYNISTNELKAASDFFSCGDINILTAQCTKINQAQPNFTALVLALEMHGLDEIKVENLLESIFVIYYAQTELRKKKINEISIIQIEKNIQWFGSFINFYNEEKKLGSSDLSQIEFLRDTVVLAFALNTLRNLFDNINAIPNEVIFAYFALLKAIETEAEKG